MEEEENILDGLNLKLINIEVQAAVNSCGHHFQIQTPFFQAPEMFSSNLLTDKQDVWSCGILLILLLTGMPPMQEGHKEFLMSKNWGSKIDFSHPSWEELSKEAKALIQNMLNPNYEKRIKAVQGLNDKWLLLLTKAKRSNQKKFLN